MKGPETYGTVKFTKLLAAISQIEDHYEHDPARLNDLEVTFEYLIGSFFPNVVENVHAEANKQYTAGYLAGLADGRKEAENVRH